MIRVLQVLPRLRRGGSQAMVMNLYRKIDRSKIQFDFAIFTTDYDDYYDEIIAMGGKVFHFTKYNVTNACVVKREWESFLSQHTEYHILHSHVRSFASIFLPNAKKNGLTTIIHSHSTSEGKGIAAVIKRLLELPLRYQADYLFACSTEAGKWLFGEKAIKKENYRFIPNVIDVPHFSFDVQRRAQKRNELGLESCYVIGHVGGFETPKNHTFLIKLFRCYAEQNPNSRLLLVGNGTYENDIRALCGKMGIKDKVVFVGLQDDVAPYLDAMDVFVFPSLWEGLPVSVVEAEASGLSCIISDRITKDVKLTDYVSYVSLNCCSDIWISHFTEISQEERIKRIRCNSESLHQFDSNTYIRHLENFYICVENERARTCRRT